MKEIVKVEGLRELQTALHELPKATAKNVVRRVLRKRAEPIAEAAQQKVPVFYGDLKNSIAVSTKLTRRQRAQHKKEGPNDIEVFVGPYNFPHAHMVEFGTIKMRAQPFMRPAWDQERYAILDHIAGDMWAEIEKATRRLAKKAAKAGGG